MLVINFRDIGKQRAYCKKAKREVVNGGRGSLKISPYKKKYKKFTFLGIKIKSW